MCYLIYIKEQQTRQSGLINMSELKGVARVATNHGTKNPATDAVHFTTAFGNDIDLPRYLPGRLSLFQRFYFCLLFLCKYVFEYLNFYGKLLFHSMFDFVLIIVCSFYSKNSV